ncbi:MAG TPA: TIGR04086 family membrane protein [Pseudoflavonifractor sp.]|nr:TIGR04086 family membrane protein [Pseudoflavonifractor sp.]
MRKNEEEQGARLIRYMLDVLLGGAVALLACFLFLLLASVAISRGWLGEDLMYQLTIVGCVLGGFVGGAVAVGRSRSRTLIVGLLVGVVFFLLLLTVGLLAYGSAIPEEGGLGLLCGALCGGAAAGILGSKPKKKRRK